MDLYIHSLICLHGVVLSSLSTWTALSFLPLSGYEVTVINSIEKKSVTVRCSMQMPIDMFSNHPGLPFLGK
jgi:hypothetical protein